MKKLRSTSPNLKRVLKAIIEVDLPYLRKFLNNPGYHDTTQTGLRIMFSAAVRTAIEKDKRLDSSSKI